MTMFEVIQNDCKCLTIKNKSTGQTMSFTSWWEINKMVEFLNNMKEVTVLKPF